MLRLAAEAALPGALPLSGLCWSAAWLLQLSVHLPALLRPAPWPVLSAPGGEPAGAEEPARTAPATGRP